MKIPALAVLLLVSSLGLAQVSDAELERLERFDTSVQEGFRPATLQTLEGIRSLGRLAYEEVHEYRSPHAASALEARELVFDGLTINMVAEKTAPHRLWVTAVTITNSSWPLNNGLMVGQRIDELARLPVSPEPGTLKFCGVNNCLIADERAGVITALRLELYLD